MDSKYQLIFDKLWELVPEAPGNQPWVVQEAGSLVSDLSRASFWNGNLEVKRTEVLSFLGILCIARKWQSYGADRSRASAQNAVYSFRIAFEMEARKSEAPPD